MQAFGVGDTVKLASGFSEITIGLTSADEEPHGLVALISILNEFVKVPAFVPQLVMLNKCVMELGTLLCVYAMLEVLSFTVTS